MSNVWEEGSSALPGISEADCQEFEAKYQIQLPPFLKEMYRLQNGGEIKNADEELVLFPIGTPDAIYGQMRSLQDCASAFAPSSLTSIYLDWIEEEFEDPGRVIVIADYYGHVKYVLDYNASNEGEEPPVVSLDFEGCDNNQVATSFEKWIEELSEGISEQTTDRTESRPSFDWNEIEKYEILYRSSFRDTFKSDGAVEEIENVLCKSRERGLIHYVRRTVNEQVVTLDSCSIMHGVLDSKLKINRCRPAPANTFGLKLESLKPGDISWATNELDSPGRWITNKSNGPPYACTVESQDRESLETLATDLKEKGFAGTPEPEPDDHLDPGMKKLWELFTGTMEVFQEKLFQTLESKLPKSKYDSDPDPDLPDIDTVDPAMRSEDENLQESIRIIRSWA
ncbi:MAG: SMI1/KNR4 family protein, partial [Planctomycetaceae bacterium]|nr:SMI1/KNR4 family protein [Planctomycetaceae bacterium]